MDEICIVMPFYNEAGRFPADEFARVARAHPEASFCLVDDGSTDGTGALLESIRQQFPDRVLVTRLSRNRGKAEAVRAGMLAGMRQFPAGYFGYFDADFSTPLEEAFRLRALLKDSPGLEFCFGSRLAIVGAAIYRKAYRHIIGRIVATCISRVLRLMVYDTQCGAKLLKRNSAVKVFDEPFISRWLFDVEIIARIIGLNRNCPVASIMREVPVSSWADTGRSKISWTYAFKIFPDLYRIRRRYVKLLARPSEKTQRSIHLEP